ncbi:MAG: metal-dependent transcriptional regulator [Magnetococcales bacterium]|nr:metal-dependent transcriptional regulator [Magnetococcales bacterium]MBF0156320.1 metal-dependent transcriptional regulator [Magnetococcales bacterium]
MDLESGRNKDELLEMLWRLHEFYELTMTAFRQHDPTGIYGGYLRDFASDGIVRLEGERIVLTPAGMEQARGLVRRHRLAERLIVDVLGMRPEETEKPACEFEHLLAPELVEAICTLLGHPRFCPHGVAIPEGPCCLEAKKQVETTVIPLTQLAKGQEARIVFLNTRDPARLQKLLHIGLVPGTSVTIQQHYPALVVEVGHSQIALEKAIGEEIRVVPQHLRP